MKKILLLASIICLTSSIVYAAEFKATEEQIKEAKHVRMAAQKMWLDQASPEELVISVVQAEDPTRELSESELKKMACIYKKNMEIQFDAPVEILARYLNDDEFLKEMTQKFESECSGQ